MRNFDEIINRYHTNSAKWDECFKNCKKDVLQMAVADMDFRSPKEIINKMQEIINHGIFGYTIFSDSYYESIISWYKKRHNYEIKKEWILYSERVGIGVSLIIQNMTKKGDGIILQTPAYPTLTDVIIKNERKLIDNPLILKNRRYEIDLEDLEERIDENTKFFIICNPHNPTGRVFTQKELENIINFCKKHNIIIISDEIHCDIVFSPNRHIVLSSIKGAEDISIICSSITKTFNLPGIITSNMIIPNKDLREKVAKILDINIIHNPNIFGAGITEIAYTDCEYWINDVINYIYKNKKYVTEFFKRNFKDLKIIDSEGTYLLWIDFRDTNLNDDDFYKFLLDKAKTNVYTGSHFGQSGKGFIRINLATPKSNIIKFLENLLKSFKLLKLT